MEILVTQISYIIHNWTTQLIFPRYKFSPENIFVSEEVRFVGYSFSSHFITKLPRLATYYLKFQLCSLPFPLFRLYSLFECYVLLLCDFRDTVYYMWLNTMATIKTKSTPTRHQPSASPSVSIVVAFYHFHFVFTAH